MYEYYAIVRSPEYLQHYGILGMKWGIRRYQNPDGSLTEEGRKRYGDILTRDQMKKAIKSQNLRNGTHQKINKKTVFKTQDGKVYDHKGRRIDNPLNAENPTDKNDKKSSHKKKMSEMTDQELREANDRMQNEITFKERYSKLHPQRISAGRQLIENFKNNLIREIPNVATTALKNWAIDALKPSDSSEERANTNLDPKTASYKDLKAANQLLREQQAYERMTSSSDDKSDAPLWSGDKNSDDWKVGSQAFTESMASGHSYDEARDSMFTAIGEEYLKKFKL